MTTQSVMLIRIRCPDVESFVAKYRRFVKQDRIFLITSSARPVGAKLRFLLELTDGTKLISGEGEVLEVRPNTGDPARPPGLRLKFRPLDMASKALVARMQPPPDPSKLLARVATKRSLANVPAVKPADARARLLADGVTEPMAAADPAPEPIVVPPSPAPPLEAAVAPSPETSFESLLDEPTVLDSARPGSDIVAIEPRGRRGDEETTGVFVVTRSGPSAGVSFDEAQGKRPAPTDGASDSEIDYFVEWSTESVTRRPDEKSGMTALTDGITAVDAPIPSPPTAAEAPVPSAPPVEQEIEPAPPPAPFNPKMTLANPTPISLPAVALPAAEQPPAPIVTVEAPPSTAAAAPTAAEVFDPFRSLVEPSRPTEPPRATPSAPPPATHARSHAREQDAPAAPEGGLHSRFLVGAIAGLMIGVPLGALAFWGYLATRPAAGGPGAPTVAVAPAEPSPVAAPPTAAGSPAGAPVAAAPSTPTPPVAAAPSTPSAPVAAAPSTPTPPVAATAPPAPAKEPTAAAPSTAPSAPAGEGVGAAPVARGMALLEVTSDPPGATVKLDGETRGQTPFSVALPADHRHQVDVELAGHKAFRRRLNIKGPSTKLDLKLPPE